jgi:phospho-N-acetylmuramoyl-pentapeptide-transferase
VALSEREFKMMTQLSQKSGTLKNVFCCIMDIVPFLFELFLYTAGAFVIATILTPFFITTLKKYKIVKTIRESTVDGKIATIFRMLHLQKQGTPTMGGILVWGTVLVVVLLSRFLSFTGVISSSLLQRTEVYLPIFTLVFVGILGAFDDFFNVREKGKHKGLSFWLRSSILLFFGLLGGLWFYFKLNYTSIHIPFYGEAEIGWWYIPLFILVIYMMSNAVNVTDGLDGLAGGLLIIAFSSLIAVSFARENYFLATFCGVIVGGLLAFLWNNIPPAKFYMGDTGAFALGATLGVIALMIDMVFILPFIGFLFFVEAGSVALQLFSKKFRGKKLFAIAPIHHHFEFIGWKESQIVMRFWIIGAFLAICGIIIGVVTVREQQALNPTIAIEIPLT